MSAARGGRPPATSTASPAAASAGPPASVTAWYPAARARRGPSSPSRASRGPHGAAPSTSSSRRASAPPTSRATPPPSTPPPWRRSAGLAGCALVALVIAPTCAALFALVFEAILRALVAVAAPRLPRTLAPSAAKTPAERDRRVADPNAARDIHAFAALKTAAHSACEARQAAASSAIAGIRRAPR